MSDTQVGVKTILQLCADTGSDTWPYRNDPRYEVITIQPGVYGVLGRALWEHFRRRRA